MAADATFYEENGFLCANGPAYEAGAYCTKKLCLVATDRDYLLGVLERFLARADCFFVKYSPAPRDAMFLGRIFLTRADEIGKAWRELKRDQKLLCSVQDDDFTLAYR